MNTHTKAVCTACGSVGYPKKAVKGSSIIELAFWVFAIAGLLTLSFPGPLLGFILLIFAISYSLWRIVSKYHACRKCGQATVIPVDTPMGRKIVADLPSEDSLLACSPETPATREVNRSTFALVASFLSAVAAICILLFVYYTHNSSNRQSDRSLVPEVSESEPLPPSESEMPTSEPSSPQLQVIAWNCTTDPDLNSAKIQGEVKNLSAAPIDDLEVSATLRDSKGNFISNTGKVFIEYRPIVPMQVSPFDVGGDYNPLIRSAQLSFTVFQNEPPFNEPNIEFVGKPTAKCKTSR